MLIRAEQKIKEYEISNKGEFVNPTIKDETYESIMKDYIEKALDIEPNFPKTLELKQRLISVRTQKIDKAVDKAKKDQMKFKPGCFIIFIVLLLSFLFLSQCGR